MKTKKIRILIAEDDRYFRLAIKNILEDHALIDEAATETDAREKLSSNYYDLALIDMQMDNNDSGIQVLKMAKANGVHSIILSSLDCDEITEEAYTNGCDHFLSKLHYKETLETYITKFIKNQDQDLLHNFISKEFITQDKEIIQDLKQLTEVNLRNRCIFITGETGVGKTLIGKLLHRIYHKETEPFVHLNCSEIPENLLEAELFGSKKGSYTGSGQDRKGKLEMANGGTLFLDEVATMPASMQQKLLKAIDEKSFYPVGSERPVSSTFTLITATCEDLFGKIERGEFRRDLFFRINGLNLNIKSLRNRTEDIPLLAKHFAKNSPRRFVIKDDAMALLKSFKWPGNVRELRKQVELLSLKSKGIITAKDLPTRMDIPEDKASSELLSPSQMDYIRSNGLRKFIKAIEGQAVSDSMQRNNGKVTSSIKELKISASALYRIMDQVHI
jgi:DNA-binding NtrC family response regulator